MTTADPLSFSGIYASTITPLDRHGVIADEDLRAHVAELAACAGLKGLLVNGHAGENAALSRGESRHALELSRAAAPTLTIVAGINAESTSEALALTADAGAAGADAIMVFPPFSWALGLDPRAIIAHHRTIHDATDLPIMLFQGSVNSGQMNFAPEILEPLLALPRVVGIKEGSWEAARYESTRRLAKRLRPEIAVMASGDEHLFTCFCVGSDGSVVSLAAVVPDLIVALDHAVAAGDMAAARALNDRIYPLALAIYAATPAGLVAARLKACLVMLGRITSGYCKSPVGLLGRDELDHLADALRLAGLAPDVARACGVLTP